MAFAFTEEQEQFRDIVARFLRDTSPTVEVRRLMETDAGFDAAVWDRLNRELGLSAVHIPEAFGGQGFSFVELGIVCEEMGRALLCAPYFSSAVLGADAILQAGSPDRKAELLPSLATGERRGALAVTEPAGGWGTGAVETVARRNGAAYRIDGAKSFVIDGHTADLIVVVAREPGSVGQEGISFFTVAGDAAGLDRQLLDTVDPTRKMARLTFRNVPAEPLGEPGAGAPALERILVGAVTALASEMVGGAQQMLDSAIDYTKLRMQFGRPIGSFQAVKHKCADMLLEVELAKSAAYQAASAVADGAADAPALASLAKAAASDTYLRAAADCIQLHGGIGFTWDNDTHLWFKRAKSSEVLFGDATHHRERMLEHWPE
ncbi:MAG: acyl-CoA/acyl-ACP dehydrogenase [Gammaproteobacteria bacterium]|nr:acyl-CoA/acyl-ACP dehydrogenase [Gammaproteobacteria bacterium]